MKLVHCLAVLLTLAFAVPASAAEDPLKLALINAASKGGDDSHSTLNGFLKKSDDIKMTGQDEVWEYAEKELGLEAKAFRSSSLREENAEKFQAIMKELDLEAILVLDVFGKGNKLQLVTIGPSGKEIADVRRDIDRGRLDKTEAKGVLKETFAELVPRVVEFRENGGWAAYEKKDEPEEEEEQLSLLPDDRDEDRDEDGDEEASLRDKAIKNRTGKYPALDPGVRLQLGLLAGKRDLKLTDASGFELTHGSPFVGFGGRVDFIFAKLGQDAAVGGSLLGGYAPFTTIFGENLTFASQYARLGLELRYLKAFSDTFLVNVFGGGEAMSITIDQNANYTGHRYIMARLGAGLMYQVGPVLLELAGALLPVFSVNNSSGAYGDVPGISLGFEPIAGLTFGLSKDLSVNLRYSGQIFSAKYPEPRIATLTAAKSFDVIHTGIIAIGYSL